MWQAGKQLALKNCGDDIEAWAPPEWRGRQSCHGARWNLGRNVTLAGQTYTGVFIKQ